MYGGYENMLKWRVVKMCEESKGEVRGVIFRYIDRKKLFVRMVINWE